MNVMKFPTISITLFFSLGILYGNHLKPDTVFLCLILSILLSFLLLTLLLNKRYKQLKHLFSVLTFFASFGFGILTFSIHFPPNNSSHYSKNISLEKSIVNGYISEVLKPNAFSFKYFYKISSVGNKICTGKLLIVQTKKENANPLKIGDKIAVFSVLSPIIKPHNPNQFDYSKYLEKKDVFHQLYLENNNYKKYGTYYNFEYYIEKFRQKIINGYQINNFETSSLNILKALLLGQRQDIDQETLNQYSQAGAIHILAISGLHIGIILFFFKALLSPIKRVKKHRYIIPILLIVILWSFALIAGLSASVVRAVAMFSFVTIGMFLKRETNIYNTIASSILILLLFNPNYLFDVGFQLSYCAVLSIVAFQPIISKLWKPKNKVISYFYDIITVSFAAQIGVLPLSLFYFHQFPGLFFLTNLVVIPLLTIILVLGILSSILNLFGLYFTFLIDLVSNSIGVMNNYIKWISSYSNFVIKDISFNNFILFGLSILIISIYMVFKKNTYKNLVICILSIIMFQSVYIYSQGMNKISDEFIVFQLPNNTILAEKFGNKINLYSNDTLAKENYIIKNYLHSNFSTINKTKEVLNVMEVYAKKMYVLDSTGIYLKNLKPDILLITQSPRINFERALLEINPKVVIVDGSNYKTTVAIIKKSCKKQNIPFHSTSEKGYYKILKP